MVSLISTAKEAVSRCPAPAWSSASWSASRAVPMPSKRDSSTMLRGGALPSASPCVARRCPGGSSS
eukprot:249641-Prorocentrum_lima.AAC.1